MEEPVSEEISPIIEKNEALKPGHDFVVLGLTGAPASGKGMWAGAAELRERMGDDFIYEESISAPAAFAGERAEEERFKRIADEVIAKLGDRKELVITAHSMGGAEALMFLKRVLGDERFKDKKIDLVVFSPINYGSEGWKGIWGWAEGTKRIMENRDLFEAHIACPLPYEVAKKISPLMTENEGFDELVIKDELRPQRRSLFEKAVRTKESSFDAYTRTQRINAIDAELTGLALKNPDQGFTDRPDVKKLLEQRAKLVAPFIGPMLDGGYLDEKQTKLLQDIYKPENNMLLGYLSPSFWKNMSLTKGYSREIIGMSYRGFSNVLEELNRKLKQTGVNLNTHLVYMRNDKFISPELAKSARQNMGDEIAVLWALADATHFTVAYQPGMMIDAVEAATGKKI